MHKPIDCLQGKNDNAIGLLASFVGQTFYGLSFLFTSVAQQTASPDVQLALRFVISFLIMSFLLLSRKNRTSLKGRPIIPLVVITLFVVGIYYLESLGVYYSNSSFASLVLSIMPVLSLAGAAAFLKEYPSRRQVIFSFFPVVGVVLITLANSQMGAITFIGVVFLLLCCVAGATGRILNRFLSRDYTAFERTYFNVFNSAVLFTIAAFLTVEDAPAAYVYALQQPSFIFSTLFLCILCSVIGELLVSYSYGALPVVKVSAISALSTVCSLVVGVVFLHEPINLLSAFGSVLTLIGIWQVNKVPNSQMQIASDTPAVEECATEAPVADVSAGVSGQTVCTTDNNN